MTIEELTKLFDDAAAQEHLRKLSDPDYKFDVRDMVHAGVTAIVRALRDEVVKVVMNANIDLPRDEAEGMVDRQFINEILAKSER